MGTCIKLELHNNKESEQEEKNMRESIHKYFQVGTIRWMSFPNRSVVDQVKRIAVDDYFDAIEVTMYR